MAPAQGPLNLAPFGVAAMSFFWSHLEWKICGKAWVFDVLDLRIWNHLGTTSEFSL